jgi:thioredoxin 1
MTAGRNGLTSTEKEKFVIQLTPETIESTVMKSPLPVVIFFTSPTCGPCRAVYPLLEAVIPEYADRLTIVKAQVETVGEWCQELKILSIPRMVVFNGGKEIKRIDPRNKGDMRLEFDAAAALVTSGEAADQAALTVYQTSVSTAKAALASANETIGAWWTAIVGKEAEAYDAAWQPLNDATDAALHGDASYEALTEEGKTRAWVLKRHALQAEDRFAEVRAQIASADAAFDAASEPHMAERSRLYEEAESTYESAIQAARLAHKEKTGAWPSGDLLPPQQA